MPADEVQITVINETSVTRCVLIFVQDSTLAGLFVNVFPTAWQVFELAPKRHPFQSGGQATVLFPAAISLAAGRAQEAFTGRVAVADVANPGEKWELHQGRMGDFELRLLENTGGEELLCVNRSGMFASLSLLKNSLPLLTYPKVPHAAMVVFQPVEIVYLAWIDWIVEGTAIRKAIASPRAVAIPLSGHRVVNASLEDDPVLGLPRWRITFG
jgi:hypothetical protein